MTKIELDEVLKIIENYRFRLGFPFYQDITDELKQLANHSQTFVSSVDKQGSTDKTSDKAVLSTTGNPVSNIPVCKCGHKLKYHWDEGDCEAFDCKCNKFEPKEKSQ